MNINPDGGGILTDFGVFVYLLVSFGSNVCGLYAIAFATCIWTRSGCAHSARHHETTSVSVFQLELMPFQWWIYGGLGGQNPG